MAFNTVHWPITLFNMIQVAHPTWTMAKNDDPALGCVRVVYVHGVRRVSYLNDDANIELIAHTQKSRKSTYACQCYLNPQ